MAILREPKVNVTPFAIHRYWPIATCCCLPVGEYYLMYYLTSTLFTSQIYHSLWQDFRTMTDLLGRLELMKQDEETFHTSEFNHHYRRISIFAKSLLCELSFSISGMDSSTPTTFVEPRLEKWCVAEAADDCARCDRDSMVLSMLSKLMSVLGQKYRHIKQSL